MSHSNNRKPCSNCCARKIKCDIVRQGGGDQLCKRCLKEGRLVCPPHIPNKERVRMLHEKSQQVQDEGGFHIVAPVSQPVTTGNVQFPVPSTTSGLIPSGNLPQNISGYQKVWDPQAAGPSRSSNDMRFVNMGPKDYIIPGFDHESAHGSMATVPQLEGFHSHANVSNPRRAPENLNAHEYLANQIFQALMQAENATPGGQGTQADAPLEFLDSTAANAFNAAEASPQGYPWAFW